MDNEQHRMHDHDGVIGVANGQSERHVRRLATMERFAAAWNAHDVDELMSCMTSQPTYDASSGPDAHGTRYVGHGDVRAAFAQLLERFPDARWNDPRHVLTDGFGVTRWVFEATQDGDGIVAEGLDLLWFGDDDLISHKSAHRKFAAPAPTAGQVPAPTFGAATRTTLQPPQLFDSRPWGFSQVVISPPGTIVHVAGQVAWDADETPVGNDRREQLVATLDHVRTAVEAAGGTLDDIQTLRIYMPHFQSGTEADIVAEVLVATFGDEHPPASTWIGVTSLAQPEYLVEIEAFAVIQRR